MVRVNFQWLVDMNPTIYGSIQNDMGQEIEFVEHPLMGDEAPIICLCREDEVAAESEFFDLCDLTRGGDYTPFFIDGQLKMRYEL